MFMHKNSSVCASRWGTILTGVDRRRWLDMHQEGRIDVKPYEQSEYDSKQILREMTIPTNPRIIRLCVDFSSFHLSIHPPATDRAQEFCLSTHLRAQNKKTWSTSLLTVRGAGYPSSSKYFFMAVIIGGGPHSRTLIL